MFIKQNQRITDDDILKKAPEIEELYQIIFFYKSKEDRFHQTTIYELVHP